MEQLWEVLVPAEKRTERQMKSGEVFYEWRPYNLSFHREWDRKVRAITGGLTIYRSAQGEWVDTAGNIHRERMIPVRLACTEEVIQQVLYLTLEHYEQEEVLAYRVSDKVLRRKKKG